jgi:hypothetical protein
MSRATTLKDLSDLEADRIINISRQKQNSRDVKLRVNSDNITVLVTKELEQFETAFISLLEKIRDKFNRTYFDIKKTNSNILSKKDISKVNPILESMTESLRTDISSLDRTVCGACQFI